MEPGARLGPYEILARLGAGGMGEVWRARDTRLDRDVAIKVLPGEFFEDKERRDRFVREAKLLAALNHPNIATIHSFEEISGRHLLVQELVKGETLSVRLAGGALPPEEVLRIGHQLADALAHAHERGVVHRDFKSANVIITPEGRAKVLDFGLAKKLSTEGLDEATTLSRGTLTEAGTVAGTPAYMAPEQLRGLPADTRSDVWALGVVLYEMATGKRPFQGKTGFELSSAIFSQSPPALPSSVPPSLQAVIEECLAKEPAARYQRGSEVRAALEAIRSGRRPSPWPALVHSIRRRPWLVLVPALVVALALGIGWWWRTRAGPGTVGKRLAVLPFENLTGDPDQAYLADGIHESLITDLARLSGFSRVIARPSVIMYVKTTKRLAEIGKELGVDTLVTGSVMRVATKLKVTAHLINTGNEEHLWSASFEREPRDILSLQNEIVRAIAEKAKLPLTPDEKTRLAAARPVNPEAYEAYLKGKYHLNKFTPEGFQKGIAYFQQSIERDPTNPLPLAALALGYTLLGHEAIPDVFDKAKAAAKRASELGGSLAETEEAIAEIQEYAEWDFAAAEASFQRAIALNPSFPDAHAHYAWNLQLQGRLEEAFAEARRSVEVDPLTPIYSAWLGWLYMDAGRFDEAIAAAKKSLEMNAEFPWGHYVLGSVYEKQRRFDEAAAAQRRAAAASPEVRWALGRALAGAGRREEALAIAAELEKDPTPMNVWGLAQIHAALGDNDAAFRWLEEGFRIKMVWMPWIGNLPYDSLRSDPRFADLKRRIGIPEKKTTS